MRDNRSGMVDSLERKTTPQGIETQSARRALIRELFVSSADLDPDEKAGTLTVRIHRMACPAHDKAVGALLNELTQAAFVHPETGARMIYELA
jgi:hypothetical protein